MLCFLQLLIPTIKENIEAMVNDKWGRHVILYLLNARDPQHVNKEIRDFLAVGDGNPFSKKDAEIRRSELRDEVRERPHMWLYYTVTLP